MTHRPFDLTIDGMRKLLIPLGVLFALITAPGAQAHHYTGHSKGKRTTVTEPTNSVLQIHNEHCPLVSEYTQCSSLNVEVANFGATGWIGSAKPSEGLVRYNTYYSTSNWGKIVAHEVGGHIDTWNEIVAKVGVNQAWTDYYDLNHTAQRFFASKGYSFTSDRAKEVWFDCAGPIKHGYGTGGYTNGIPESVCNGHEIALQQALDT